MIVFLSSPDMTGKTQIAKALARVLEVPYYKASTERSAFVSDQSRFINDIRWACPARLDMLRQFMAQGFTRGFVSDRSFVCQWTYSRFFGRERDDAAVEWLDSEYAKLGAYIVMPYRTSYENVVDDLNPALGSEALRRLQELYDEYATLTRCTCVKLCVDSESLFQELIEVLSAMGHSREDAEGLLNEKGYFR